MPAEPITTAPAIEIIGDDTAPSDTAISALARLLLADDTHTHSTPPPAAAVASVSIFAATHEE